MYEWGSRVSNSGLSFPSVANSGAFSVSPPGTANFLVSIFPGQAKEFPGARCSLSVPPMVWAVCMGTCTFYIGLKSKSAIDCKTPVYPSVPPEVLRQHGIWLSLRREGSKTWFWCQWWNSYWRQQGNDSLFPMTAVRNESLIGSLQGAVFSQTLHRKEILCITEF